MSEELEDRIKRKRRQLEQIQKFRFLFKNEDEFQKRIDALLEDLSKLMKQRD